MARRLQDVAEEFDTPLIMALLDWEKTFDNIDKKRLVLSLKRFNIPDPMIDVISSIYHNPKFRIKDSEGYSSVRPQSAGIRQGCPLSPYLFVLQMTVLFNDVHTNLGNTIHPARVP